MLTEMDAMNITDAAKFRMQCTEPGSEMIANATTGETRSPTFDLRFLCAGVIGGFSKLAHQVLDPAELTLVQWGVLERCAKGQADTVTSLAECIPIDPASISRAADHLARLGFLQRRRLRRDRRVVRLEATDDGQAFVRRLDPQLQAIYVILTEGIEEAELQVFARVAQKMSANAHGRHPEKGGR